MNRLVHLDTETSIQVMEILKEISKDRLIIMVTHNPELAEQYSSRIIRVLDGKLTDDSRPMTEEEYQQELQADKAENEKTFDVFWHFIFVVPEKSVHQKGKNHADLFCRKHWYYWNCIGTLHLTGLQYLY